MKIYLYNVDDDYIKYLRDFDKNICDSKIGKRIHTRKYIGVVIKVNGFDYFAPLSSPKKKDYLSDNSIRKDPLFLIKIISKNESGQDELKARILIGNMIPVPKDAMTKYNPSLEKDENYKILVIKELEFITKNRKEIYRKSRIIYNQKIGRYKTSIHAQKYLICVPNYKLLEEKSKRYKKS